MLKTDAQKLNAVRPSILGEIVYHHLGTPIHGSYLSHIDLDIRKQILYHVTFFMAEVRLDS